jgi:TRAP-type C4-dicarboxylate transport system permease small subunit
MRSESPGRVLGFVRRISRLMFWISCGAILTIVFLTTVDVVSRRLGNPIDFTYELVLYLGAITIGFAIPQATIDRAHVVMDFLTVQLPPGLQRAFNITTRFLAIAMFGIIGWHTIKMGSYLHTTGQASAILNIPDYPVAYGIGFCCFIECVVLFFDVLEGSRGQEQ